MNDYSILRMYMSSPNLDFDMDLEVIGNVEVIRVPGARAKWPAVLVRQLGHFPMAPSASVYMHENGITMQLFRAGVDDSGVAGASPDSLLWIESEGRALRLWP